MFNRVKIATFDKLAFPEHILKPSDFLVYRKGYPFRENNMKTDGILDERVKRYMDQWYDWTQEEFILVWDQPCVIEPVTGWAITSSRKLLYYSLGISRTWFLARPKLFDFISRKGDAEIGNAISFRDTGEENYFHFFNDVLAKYFFLKQHNISFEDRSVIISEKLYSKPFFQWYLSQSPEFQKIKWVVQGRQYLAATSVVFCKPLTHRKDLFDEVFKPLRIDTQVSKRVFINRGKSRLRTIGNFEEVMNVLRKHSIEIIDPDLLSPAEQQTIFSQASFIAGIHGAGFTNVYFRNGNCSVLEIFPPPSEDYLPFHYIMLAGMKGFPYQAIIGDGTRLDISGSFSVDVQKLETLIVSMLL
ncbi:MAG: glycosyltransferase family 61 protein [Bacteroidota bacterium]